MSKTYRKVHGYVTFCNECNKPLYGKYKGHTENCTCEDEYVEMEVRKWTYKEVEKEYLSGLDFWITRSERVPDGWTIEEYRLPRSTYKRYGLELLDGNYTFPNGHEGRKEAQTYLNKRFRAKENQVLRDRNTDWEDKAFPVNKKGVNWEIY